MTNFEKMQASYEQMETVRKQAKDIVLEAKTSYREELSGITNDRMLSEEGKQQAKEQLSQRYRDILLGEMMKMKDKATEAADKTIDLATKILLEDPAQPEETELAMFNQKLADLKTSLLLAPNPERGVESLKAFIEETSDPYLAKQLQAEFHDMAASIVKDGSASEKVKLNDLYTRLKSKSMTDEQKRAETLQGLAKAGRDSDLLLDGGVHHNAIKELFGPETAMYANKPHEYFDRMIDEHS
ncbi:hypothetical protein [Bacillus sonorensis]|uniref:hypothetical protein n=1 Tax=Bacillus sonorensis TaxID=119858 RepID=UPI00228101F1|nr:hypothetical protein [Bacillus sonorensis]MCY8272432.1 hypothetical protein [Bacillus sonorensis]MCY8607134.1 hypothetical protein [Bacillus sonorensis]